MLVLSRPRQSELNSSANISITSGTSMVYDLYMLPKTMGSSNIQPEHVESRSGSGIAVAWIGRNRFAVLESSGSVSSIYFLDFVYFLCSIILLLVNTLKM